jgi:signal peptidase I
MSRRLIKDTLGWGFILWLIGYALGFVFFALVPANMIGWFIMPIGAVITLWVAFNKVTGDSMRHYGQVALAWTLIAVLGDYLFIVKMLKPADGYYKPDVYLYYALTLAIPLLAGWRRTSRRLPGV